MISSKNFIALTNHRSPTPHPIEHPSNRVLLAISTQCLTQSDKVANVKIAKIIEHFIVDNNTIDPHTLAFFKLLNEHYKAAAHSDMVNKICNNKT